MNPNVILLIIGICILIFFSIKKKKNKEIAEEQAKQEKLQKEEAEKQLIESLEIKWQETKQSFQNNGLPILTPDTLKLKKNEFCHFIGDASFCKIKQSTIGYEGGSRGVSFRVIKGVNFRIGNYQGHPIKKEIIENTNGTIYLTSEKIVFTAISHSCVIKYKDILNLSVIESLLQIQTEERTYLFQVEDSFNFMVILDYIINIEESIN